MREVLFRAKSAEDTDAAFKGQWAKGFLVQDQTGDMFGIVGGFGIIGKRNNGNNCFIAIDPETAGEYTGLKDKNGIEIFEGDILGSGEEIIGHIVGGVRGYCYDVIYSKPSQESGTRWPLYYTVVEDYAGRVEVIGNIHDNPELLEERINEH